jgi:hypothetical protein
MEAVDFSETFVTTYQTALHITGQKDLSFYLEDERSRLLRNVAV